MYENKIQKLKEIPVFSLSDMAQIVSGKEYAKKLLRRLTKEGDLYKIKKGIYSFYDDPFLVSSFLVKPSYISSASALSYHKLITQIPLDIFCSTTKRNKNMGYNSKIKFFHTNYFFGFENEEYMGFKIPIATPEKAIIDSFGIIPVSIFEETIETININKIKDYLRIIKKSSLTKRIGYLLERYGFDVSELKNKINNKYIPLDPIAKKTGEKNKEWKLIINIKLENDK